MDGNVSFNSHPEKKLKDHLSNVANLMCKVHKNKKIMLSSLMNNFLKVVGLSHDFGKYTNYFQKYLNCKKKDTRNLYYHGFISALFSAWRTKTILGEEDNYWPVIAYFVIKHHHGNLTNFKNDFDDSVDNFNILKEQLKDLSNHKDVIQKEYGFEIDEFLKNYISVWKYLKRKEFCLKECETNERRFDIYFQILYVYSLLIYSDKTDVVIGKTENIFFPDNIYKFIDNYKEKKFKGSEKIDLNKLREDVYNVSLKNIINHYNKTNIFSLNLPTGAGKTLTVLNLAFNLLKKDKNLKKVIYALPFTSIVDQTEKVVRDIFETNKTNSDDYLIVHHHLAEIKIKNDESYIDGDKAEFLIENWDKPLVLTTFWQLFNSIITNKNSRLRKFHNIANSIIILDEIQSIPYKYWDLINRVFKKLTELFNCKIIFLTATMPLIFEEEKKEIVPVIPSDKRQEYFSKFSRYKINIINNLNDITIDKLYNIAKNDIENNNDKSFLFVFNTIKTSIMFFNKLKEDFFNKELIYLSSNVLPFERKKRIFKIRENPREKIIVSTQVVEAGVDIDLDIVYRDFSPLDSIIQSAGRCNRNDKKRKGTVNIFKLRNEQNKYDCIYIYSGLLLDVTNAIFNDKDIINEGDVLPLIDEYYRLIKKHSSKDTSREIIDAINELQYENVEEKFKLIEEKPSFLMFIEIDERAKELLSHFRELINIKDRFERKNEFLKMKSEFYQYVLSVKLSNQSKSYYNSFEEIENLKIVSDELVESVYDFETGLKMEWSIFL